MITQKPFSQNKPVSPLPEAEFFPIVVSRPRKVLHQRIEERVRQMIEQGLERETKALLQKYGPKAPGLNSIGYSEWFDFFSNEKSIEQVIEEIIINSRQYAKRQETWFRKRPGTQMHNLEDPRIHETIFSLVNDFLKKF
jgi:tRNA dimethylallyltransferase